MVLAKREIPVSAAEREQILACTDTARLAAWLERALTAKTCAALFAPEMPR
jgi:hypothetical protein